jgi:hypothetical protein
MSPGYEDQQSKLGTFAFPKLLTREGYTSWAFKAGSVIKNFGGLNIVLGTSTRPLVIEVATDATPEQIAFREELLNAQLAWDYIQSTPSKTIHSVERICYGYRGSMEYGGESNFATHNDSK